MLNLAGRDQGGYYHELFLRGKVFLSRRIQRIKVKGRGTRKAASPETEPNFYITSFLPSTSLPSKTAQVSMMGTPMMALGPSMHLDTGGSPSLHQLLTSSAFVAASQPHFHTSAKYLMEEYQSQAHLQHLHMARLRHLRMARLLQEMDMVASIGQQNIPAVWDRHATSIAMALALSRSHQQDSATSPHLWRGYLG
jgi:hypothetical protein